MKGYVYIMTTAVDGIIKIGRSDNWKQRCQSLKENGYKNLNGLDTFFVVEVNDPNEIESRIGVVEDRGNAVTDANDDIDEED